MVGHKKAAIEPELEKWPEAVRGGFLDSFDAAYWRALDTDTHRRHAALLGRTLEDSDGDQVAYITAAPDSFRDVTQVSILTRDRPGLFALLAGALTRLGGSIADAKAFTGHDGRVLDVFWVQDVEDSAFDDPQRLGRMESAINALLLGADVSLPPLSMPLSQMRQKAFSIEPQVIIDNEASSANTLIEVNGLDRPGLLHDLATVLAEQKITISSAHVATFGERAIDVFYARDQYGLKITRNARLEKIRDALLRVLVPDETAGAA